MRRISTACMWIWLAGAAVSAQAPAKPAPVTPEPPTERVGTMSELMVHLIYPTSDAVFYISSRTPQTEAQWVELQAKTLTLAESANLLMLPGRARDRDRWIKDAKLMLHAARAAFDAAKAKDVAALEAVSDRLYQSCVTCHKDYRKDYGAKPRG
jgi:hypothetical protein